MRTTKFVFALVTVIGISACGEAHRDAAIAYHSSAEQALIKSGKCADQVDCSKRELAFWAGGNKSLPWADKAYVSVYNVSDQQTISLIKQKIKEKRTAFPGAPCQLTVFDGSHASPGNKVIDETL